MSRPKGRNINLVKAHNVSAILYYLLRNKLVSRVELAEKLALSNTTITNLTAELLEEGIILEKQIQADQKRKRVGRPRQMLELVPDARFAVGVHIGVGIYRIAVTNLFAKILTNQVVKFDLAAPPESILADMAQKITEVLEASGVDRDRVIGIGVGASGLIDHQSGVNLIAPRLGWKDVGLRHLLEAQLDFPIAVDNNVRAMALGEAFFGVGRKADTLAFVYGRIGVGAGFVVNRQIFRGSGAGAGEIGHTIMVPQGGQLCSCGNTGCLETLISEPVLLKQAQQYAAENPTSLLAQLLQSAGTNQHTEQVFAAARQGDPGAVDLIYKSACYLGIALANLVNILNPDMIFLGGMFAQGSDLIIPVAEAKMKEAAFAGLGDDIQIKTTEFGWRAGVIGAASLALTSFFYQQNEGS